MIFCDEIGTNLVKLLLENPNDKRIDICSPGGCVYSSLAAANLVAEREIVTHGVGMVMSGAVIVLASGTHRTATAGTRFMVHAVLGGTAASSAEEAAVEGAEFTYVQEAYFNLLASCSKHTAAWWRKKCASAPFYFTAAEALKLGLIDAISP